MEDSRSPLEDEVRSLAASVADLQRRLAAVEESLGASPDRVAATARVAPEPDPAGVEPLSAQAPAAARLVPLGGRLLVVLGGAYVVRALTDDGVIPQGAGVALGLLYALLWLGIAARAARAGDAQGAGWHAASTALIAFPLIWETAYAFASISHPVAAATLGLVTLLGLGVAARYRLRTTPAVFTLGAAVCGHAILLPAAASTAPLTIVLVLLGLCVLAMGRRFGWEAPLWITAVAANAAALYVVTEALDTDGALAPALGIGILLSLFLGYAVSIAHAAIRGRHRLDEFGVTQTALVLLVGFGGALWVARARDVAPTFIGFASLAIALLAYVFAFTVLDRERRRCFYYLASIGLVLVLAGSGSLLTHPALPWAVLAVAAALLARRFDRFTLSVHASLYVAAAALASGLLRTAADGWLASGDSAWTAPTSVALLALAAAGVCALVRARGRLARTTGVPWIAPMAPFLIIGWAGGGLLVHAVAAILPRGPAGLDPGVLAAVRTAVLAMVTILTAGVSRIGILPPARYLVYPLLCAGAVKLLLEDLRSGRAATLAVSFVLYGAVMILAPRLVRSPAAATDEPGTPSPQL